MPSFESWPYTGKRCVVLTREKRPSSKCGEEFSSDTPKKLVARLVSGGAKSIYVEGGAVIQSLLAAGLVTDLTVSIVPVLLGEGIPLFGNAGPDMRLELVGSRVFDSGLVQVEYRAAKTPRPGEARKTEPKNPGKRPKAKLERETPPKDVIGFLLALPIDPTSVEVSHLAHEFGITGPVEVKTYTAPDDNIHFDLIEGDPGYSVTRYPKDMQGCIGRLANHLIDRLGRSSLARGELLDAQAGTRGEKRTGPN